jgi:hypothetical protein
MPRHPKGFGLNALDISVAVFVVLVVGGIVAVQSGMHTTASQMVDGESDIRMTVVIRNLKTKRTELFKPGDMVSLTIRNHPRGEVKVISSATQPMPVLAPGSAKGYQVVADPTDPDNKAVELVLQDHATVTKEGYVANGVKMKLGMPIEIENFDVRVPGVIADIQAVSSSDTKASTPADTAAAPAASHS